MLQAQQVDQVYRFHLSIFSRMLELHSLDKQIACLQACDWWKKIMKKKCDAEHSLKLHSSHQFLHACSWDHLSMFLHPLYYGGLKFVPPRFKRLVIVQSVHKVKLNL